MGELFRRRNKMRIPLNQQTSTDPVLVFLAQTHINELVRCIRRLRNSLREDWAMVRPSGSIRGSVHQVGDQVFLAQHAIHDGFMYVNVGRTFDEVARAYHSEVRSDDSAPMPYWLVGALVESMHAKRRLLMKQKEEETLNLFGALPGNVEL